MVRAKQQTTKLMINAKGLPGINLHSNLAINPLISANINQTNQLQIKCARLEQIGSINENNHPVFSYAKQGCYEFSKLREPEGKLVVTYIGNLIAKRNSFLAAI